MRDLLGKLDSLLDVVRAGFDGALDGSVGIGPRNVSSGRLGV